MADYSGKVYRKVGGDELVVASGGKITVEAGGTIDNDGDVFVSATFDANYFEVEEGAVSLKASVAALLDLVAAIPTTDPADDGVTIWNDNGVLKVSGASG